MPANKITVKRKMGLQKTRDAKLQTMSMSHELAVTSLLPETQTSEEMPSASKRKISFYCQHDRRH